jgi:folate-binding protein YgfZ
MTAETFQDIAQNGAAVNLSARAKFRLTGNDRIRYLNGQVTNDVRRASAQSTLYACVTDAKGRIAGDVFIHATEDALLLDAEPGLRESLGLRLERYIVADDAELTDVSDEWQLWHVWGANIPQGIPSTRFGREGVDVWQPVGTTFEPGCQILTDEDLETWRILQKVPRWPHELNAETFPPEAGLEARAMDFFKGCYIGQEVLSRIKTTGKMPREMIAWEMQKEGFSAQIGDEIRGVPPSGNVVTIGVVTSVSVGPQHNKTCGLGYVKQGAKYELLLLPSGLAQRC